MPRDACRRCREPDRVLCDRRPARVGHDLSVRDGGVAAVDRQRDRERRLERRLVKARKRPARVGGLELRDGVLPELGPADVEAAQLAVQEAGVPDVELGRSFGERRGHGQRRGLILLVERDGGGLRRRAGADRHLSELNVQGVEHEQRRRLRNLDAYRFGPFESLVPEIDGERQVVVVRCHNGRKSLGRSG